MFRRTTFWLISNNLVGKCLCIFSCLLVCFYSQSGYGQNTNPENTPPATILESGKPVERELSGGQKQSYQISLSANQYAGIIVEQRGIDVVARLFGADGQLFLEFDAESRTQGEEIIEFAAETAGNYRLELEAKYKLLPAGRYQIRLAELRPATETDKALQEARRLHSEAFGLRRAGKVPAALPVALRAFEIREKNLAPEHPDLAATLNLLGNLYSDTSDFEKAESFYQRALAIRKKVFGDETPAVAATLSDLGVLNRRRGKPESAAQFYRNALAIREKSLGKEHPEVANLLNNLANVALDNGDFIEAEALYNQSLAIRLKTLGEDHPLMALTFNGLAIVYGELGDYIKAEAMYLRGLKIDEKILPPDHPSIAIYLDNLAGNYRDMGDFARAEPLYKRALMIRENALGPDDLMVSATLNNLGGYYTDVGEYAEAEKAYLRSLEIREKKLKTDHPWVAQSLFNLGDLFYQKGDLAKAEPYFLRSLAVSEKVFEPNHPSMSYALLGLANVYRDLGNFEKAEPLYRRVISIYDEAFGKDHPNKARILTGLATLYLAKGDLTTAVATQTQANAIAEKNISLNLVVGSEHRKLSYLASLSEMFDRTLTLNFYTKDKREANELALTSVLQRKGRILDAMADTFSVLRRRFNQEDQKMLDKLNETNARLALLVLNGPNRLSLTEYQQKISSLETTRDNFEAEISRRAAGFFEGSKPITLESVRKSIPENSVLVEFAVYHPVLPKSKNEPKEASEPRYVAYIVGNDGVVKSRDLGNAGKIDKTIETFRQALFDPKREDVRSLARALDEILMKPVRPLLGSRRQLLLSPDGQLNLIPFEALVDEQNHFLVENFSVSYLTSGRDLLRLQTPRPSKNQPVIIANPNFGSPDPATLSTRDPKTVPQTESRRSVTAARNLSETYFAPLAGTAQEARSIQTLFPEARFLTQTEATEAALKQTVAPRLLHIATHGFFLEDKTDTKTAAGRGIENPLLRSGLALAGANERREGAADDGILTALEASGLNLWGTKLVVLSACDTGLGEVRNGEGVYGLRRAFLLAGTESLVMSLWSVSDQVTRELMTSYYKQLKEGRGRGEGWRAVQLEMLKRPQREHPFYWASFIQSGEWANLDGKR